METVYVVVAIVILLQVAVRYANFNRALSQAYQMPTVGLVKGSELPDEYKSFHRVAHKPLSSLGFKLVAVAKQIPIETIDGAYLYTTIFYNAAENTFAWLHNSVTPTELDPVTIQFFKVFRNGDLVATDNEHSPYKITEHKVLQWNSISSENAEEIWTEHQNNVKRYKSQNSDVREAKIDVKTFVKVYNRAWKVDLEKSIEKGLLSGSTERFFLGMAQAFKFANSIHKRTQLRVKETQRRSISNDRGVNNFSNVVPAELTLRPQLDVVQWVIKALAKKGERPILPWITLLISGGVFCVFFGVWLGWEIVPILLAVLLIHEMGHFLAMRVFGYTNTSIYFLPGLGAAAQGEAGGANFWQRLAVFYAGPVPGLILAFVLWFAIPNPSGLILAAIIMLVVINWFNLLPFMPLDGGQVLHLCLSEKSRLVFLWISAAGLILFAWVMSEPILWVVGAYSAFTALSQSGLLSLRNDLYKLSQECDSKTEFLEKGLRVMQAPAYRNIEFNQRALLLKEFASDLSMPPVKIFEKLVGFVTYPIFFLLPVFLFIGLLAVGDLSPESVKPERDWMTEVSASQNIDAKVSLAIEATNYYLDLYDSESANDYIDILRDISANEEEKFSGLKAITLGLAIRSDVISPYEEKSAEQILGDVTEYLNLQPEEDQAFFNVLNASFPYVLSVDSNEIERIFLKLESYLISGDRLSELAAVYFQMAYKEGETSASWLEKAVDVAPDDEKNRYRSSLAQEYLLSKKYDMALSLYDQIHKEENQNGYADLSAYAWAAYKHGNYDLSLKLLSQQESNYSDAIGGNLLTKLLWGSSGGEAYLVQINLAKLIVADAANNKSEVDKAYKLVMEYSDQGASLGGLKDNLMDWLKYDETWNAEMNRQKIVVLDRYFGDVLAK